MPPPWVAIPVESGVSALEHAAGRTGGKQHSAFFGRASVVTAFQQAFEDFRQSYILRYTPAGVARPGWHDIKVGVPGQARGHYPGAKGLLRYPDGSCRAECRGHRA